MIIKNLKIQIFFDNFVSSLEEYNVNILFTGNNGPPGSKTKDIVHNYTESNLIFNLGLP